MKTALLFIILLSNEGHWISGNNAQVTAQWTADAAAVPSDLLWELKYGDVRLGAATEGIAAREPAVVKITCPDVRTRIPLRWEWRLRRTVDGKEIATGAETIVAYPATAERTRGWPELLRGKHVVVIDRPSGLPAILEAAKVPFDRLDDVTQLQRVTADVVIVGEDMMSDSSPFEQSALTALNRSGASVVVFRQMRVAGILGYPLASRAAADRFEWETKDPLLAGFEEPDLRSWERGWNRPAGAELRALRVAALGAVRAPTFWRVEAGEGAGPVAATRPASGPVDALLLWHSDGGPAGRQVLCQMPLGPWMTDPRSQVLLGNVLDALLAPPAPPVPPAAPADTREGRPARTIDIPTGDP